MSSSPVLRAYGCPSPSSILTMTYADARVLVAVDLDGVYQFWLDETVPLFSGTLCANSTTLFVWLSSLRDIEIASEHRLVLPLLYLTGEAWDWFVDYHSDDTTKRPNSWSHFEHALRERFPESDRHLLALQRVAEAIFGETIEDLVEQFGEAHELYPERPILNLTWDFVQRLPPGYWQLRDELLEKAPKDFDELCERAKGFELCEV
ncbi:hypothetical protein PSEUBRA_002323 [Kalmanozyma brasiliensis GHG001]|uniref:uncharacterized protein n=1 Tax=Kalmanozyma brasiliensis (strain GHG001) TaxID=1365824 RepID=UPI0028681E09|nr:uncharacterized protein PSEUBRA_002323 [Kalmanozyma brasiliensis GHG001]KAF6767068.1 hypothetical protein PSEUBRA_002323 [Kalmanozyma brasiliensis GHG001]